MQGKPVINKSDQEAYRAIDKILAVIGIKRNFAVIACDKIQNAVATSYKGIRYIIYDPFFISTINKYTNSWSSASILAHEIGHHINGHSLDLVLYSSNQIKPITLNVRREQELEADEFSGFVLAKLGATLNQACEAIKLVSNDSDDSKSSHPSRSKRISSIKQGFDRAKMQIGSYSRKETNTSIEHYYSALEKESFNDYKGAIEEYSNAISINKNFVPAYIGRALLKWDDEKGVIDYLGAINDYEYVLKTEPLNHHALSGAGIVLAFFLNDRIEDAIKYFTKAIEVYSKSEIKDIKTLAMLYDDLGRCKMSLSDEALANSALNDFQEAIKLDPRNPDYFISIGKWHLDFSQPEEGCRYFKKAIGLGSEEAKKLISKYCAKYNS